MRLFTHKLRHTPYSRLAALCQRSHKRALLAQYHTNHVEQLSTSTYLSQYYTYVLPQLTTQVPHILARDNTSTTCTAQTDALKRRSQIPKHLRALADELAPPHECRPSPSKCASWRVYKKSATPMECERIHLHCRGCRVVCVDRSARVHACRGSCLTSASIMVDSCGI